MALIPCHECGAQISSDAVKCPQCGATKRIVAQMQMLWLVAIAVAVIVAMVVALSGD